MKKYYYVVEARKGDEWVLNKTESLADAIKSARFEYGNLTKKEKGNTTVEIRQYEDDIENEDCTNFDYDLIEWGFVIRDREAGNLIEIVKSIKEAEDLLWDYIKEDAEEEGLDIQLPSDAEKLLSFYEVYDPATDTAYRIEWSAGNEEVMILE